MLPSRRSNLRCSQSPANLRKGAWLLTLGLLAACGESAPTLVDGARLALQDDVWITTSRDSVELVRRSLGQAAQRMELRDGNSARNEVALRVPRAALEDISEAQHREHHRCGGFVFRGTEAVAMAALSADEHASKRTYAAPYTLDNQATVDKLLPEAKDANVLATIKKLSSFRTRFHSSPTGKEASVYIRDSWQALSTGRDDVSVELVDHKGTPQPSIKLTIRGTSLPDEIVVLGGHMDSLAGRGGEAIAPGADDNASGIASLTEVVRAALTLNYHPARTVHVYGYAAEEVGLVGSAEIAAQAKADDLNVVGVLQLDMTNYTGASMPYIGLLTDYVDPMLSDFSVKLIEQYVKIPYKRFECGYACSDHASWTEQGFPAAMPHESNMDDSNQDIHTAEDTLARSDDSVAHSMHFVRFGLAFMAEVAKGGLESAANPLACDATKPCAAGQRCDAGTCVPELDAGMAGAPSCTSDSECATGQSCQSGVCAAAKPPTSTCSAMAPCPIGLVCTAGACTAPAAAGAAATTSPDAGMLMPPSAAAAPVVTAGAAALPPTGSAVNAVSMPVAAQSESPAPQASGCSAAGGERTRRSMWPLLAAALGLFARRRYRRA